VSSGIWTLTCSRAGCLWQFLRRLRPDRTEFSFRVFSSYMFPRQQLAVRPRNWPRYWCFRWRIWYCSRDPDTKCTPSRPIHPRCTGQKQSLFQHLPFFAPNLKYAILWALHIHRVSTPPGICFLYLTCLPAPREVWTQRVTYKSLMLHGFPFSETKSEHRNTDDFPRRQRETVAEHRVQARGHTHGTW